MYRSILVCLMMTFTLLVGCDASSGETPTVPASATVAPEESPTQMPAEEETAAPTPTISATATAEPSTVTPEPTAAAPETTPEPVEPALLPGILYQYEMGLWQVDASGEGQLLVPQPDAQLSPAGDEALYLEDGDVWTVDLESGEARNVTAESGRIHVHAQWWPANPDVLVLNSFEQDSQGPTEGFLTLVNRDGSDYVVVEQEAPSYALPAPAPDGETIAYDEAGSAWLYDLESGREPFDPGAYDLPEGVNVPRIASPAWSPDMEQLAWIMGVEGGGYGQDGSWDIVLGVFDLQEESSQLLHPFEPVGRGGWFPNPVWSPDGEWISFTVESFDAVEEGRWVAASDGSSESRLSQDAGSTAVWSPAGTADRQDGAYLVVDGEEAAWLVESGTWEQTELPLPAGARVSGWQAVE